MNSKLNPKEREHLSLVKSLPCGVCGAAAPSDAHHIRQGLHYLCIPLCKACHISPRLGWHGEKVVWKIRKLDELIVLNETIKRLKKGS